jgi:predicted molibdopterin-dependent oxidoreductase YjgC
VCGLCPVGCNVSATTREGKVKRILSRNHPEVDEGWLCDKGRFAYSHLGARDRIGTPLSKAGPRRFEQMTWDDALDRAEELLRDAGSAIVTALSGGESVEQAYGLGKLLRQGLGAHDAVLPEAVPDRLDQFRAPLSSIRSAKTIAVATGEPVVERAPIVDLWLKAARRAGAEITYGEPTAPVDVLVTDDADCAERCQATDVYFLPRTPNGRGVADAWSAAADGEPGDEKARLLIISGDEAAADPAVRALAADAQTVIGIGMFEDSFRGLADLVLPATSYLERDGTTVNLEGRLQRQRRTVPPPCPDELAWIAKLAERFDVELSPYTSVVFDEVAAKCFGGISFGDIGEIAELPPRAASAPRSETMSSTKVPGTGLTLVAYKPLFSGAAVERTPELQFQKAEAEVQIARGDAQSRGIRNGQTVTVSSNGTSVELRARIANDLAAGTVRIAADHAADLHANVEVKA